MANIDATDGASFMTAVRQSITSLRAEVDALNAARAQDQQRMGAIQDLIQRQGLEQERINGNVTSLGYMMSEHDKVHNPYMARVDSLVEQVATLQYQCSEDAKILNERFPVLEAQGQRLNELINSLNRQVPMAFDKIVKRIDFIGLKSQL